MRRILEHAQLTASRASDMENGVHRRDIDIFESLWAMATTWAWCCNRALSHRADLPRVVAFGARCGGEGRLPEDAEWPYRAKTRRCGNVMRWNICAEGFSGPAVTIRDSEAARLVSREGIAKDRFESRCLRRVRRATAGVARSGRGALMSVYVRSDAGFTYCMARLRRKAPPTRVAC